MVAERHADIPVEDEDAALGIRDNGVETAIHHTLPFPIVDNPEVIVNPDVEILGLQHPLALTVDHTVTVALAVLDDAIAVVEDIAVGLRRVLHLRVHHHPTGSVDELDHPFVVHSRQPIGENPGMAVLWLDDRQTGEHIEIAAFLAVAVAY